METPADVAVLTEPSTDLLGQYAPHRAWQICDHAAANHCTGVNSVTQLDRSATLWRDTRPWLTYSCRLKYQMRSMAVGTP